MPLIAEEVNCYKCKGDGKMDCPSCRGKGYSLNTGLAYDYRLGGYKGELTRDMCGVCAGTGTRTCSECQGSGEETRKRPATPEEERAMASESHGRTDEQPIDASGEHVFRYIREGPAPQKKD